MPVKRGEKKRTPEEVPDAGDPERKRVLNILAQRRYRQRQKERIAGLEAQAKSRSTQQPENSDEQDLEVFPVPASTASPRYLAHDPPGEILQSSDESSLAIMDFGQNLLNLSLFEDTPQTPSSPAPTPTLSAPLSNDLQLQFPVLNALRAFSNITSALNLMEVVWDPHYLHTLPPTPIPNVPSNFFPTPAQQTIPHHPILDVLPWPSVRDKLIYALSLPSMYRPPIAQDDDPSGTGQAMAIQRLSHDIHDLPEGVRVHGNTVGGHGCNELTEDAWEIGECFYRNWWFCIDEEAVATSNRRRRERGVQALRLKV